MASPGFNIRALQGIRAHFKQASGPSRAGADWTLALTNSGGERRILVRTYTDDVGQLSAEQEVQLVVEYVRHLIQSGWSPDQYRGEPGELLVPKGFGCSQTAAASQQRNNQPLQPTRAAEKRSWFQRLFGRGPGR
jgi:hypothetical protein